MKGVISAIEYKNEVTDPTLSSEDPRRLRPTIFIWTRGEDGKRYRFVIKGFRPYFYCNNAYKIWSNDVEKSEPVFQGIKKVYTYLPAQVRKLRKVLEKYYDQGGIMESDVLYTLRFLIDSKIKGPVEWDIGTNTLKPLDEDVIVPLRKLFIDIELWSEKGNTSRRSDIIKCLSTYDSFTKKYNTWYVNDEEIHMGTSEWETHRCSKESDLLKAFFNYFARKDPDIVSGYNVDFDLLCIKRRASKNGLSAYIDVLSALHTRVTKDGSKYGMGRTMHRKLRIRGVDWARNGINIDGRNIIDILDLSRMVSPKQLESYTLDFVAKEFLGKQEGKIIWQGKPIASHIKDVWDKEPEIVLRYNMHDVELCVMLDDRLSLISLLDELRLTVGVRLEDAYSNQRMIDAEFLRRSAGKNPKNTWKGFKNEEKFPGGLVLDPIPGLHKFVALLDFKSLYPSVIRTLNIDQESWHEKGKDVYSWADDLSGFIYYFGKEPRGLFPKILDDFSKKRDAIKERMSKEKDPFKKKVLSAREGALKILSNAMYGCMTPDTEVITPEGRKFITELALGDWVYTLNPKTLKVELSRINELHEYPFEGNLISLKGNHVDFLLTPNHDFLVEDQYHKREKREVQYLGDKTNLSLPKLQELESGKTLNPSLIKLLAWYISEGSIYHNKEKFYPNGNHRGISNKIHIAQWIPSHRKEIIKIIGEAGFVPRPEKNGISFSNEKFSHFLERECGKGSYNKRIPSFVKIASLETLKIFFEEIMKGDGRKRGDSYRTVSNQLKRDMVFICARLGWSCHSTYPDGCWNINIGKKHGTHLFLDKQKLGEFPYKGKVHCITVAKNHIILAGRNGRFQWTGQSFAFTSRKTSKVCASAVTSSGRMMLRFGIKIASEEGFTVAYGDTDSIFVELNAHDLEEAKKKAEGLVNKINSLIPEKLKEFGYEGEQLISIKLECVYSKIFFMTVKKRYCGMKEDGKLDTKGLEIKRSDSSVFSKRLQENVIRSILNEQTSEEIKTMVEKELNCFNLEPYEAVGVPSALTKKFEEYKTNSIQKKAAYFSNTYLKTRFEFGSKPLRIYVTMVSQPEEVMENVDVVAFDENTIIPAWLKMDSKKMLKKTVKPKIEELLKTLGIEWTSLNLKEELKEIKKVKVKKKKKEGKKDKVKKGEKGPLDSFIGGK